MHSALRRCIAVAGLAALSTSQAATYYVRNGGDDAADGLSHDTAWATLEHVRAFDFEPGDRVVFHEGHRWEGQLVVDWPGTDARPAIVGAYHLENGAPVWGFETQRPIIDGTDTIPERYDGLVRVTADRVRVENLEIVNSEGRGITFTDVVDGKVVNCVTANTYGSGIHFLRSDSPVIRFNRVTEAGRVFPEDGGTWGGAIELVATDDGWVGDNSVAEVYGEGINANDGSARIIIERNSVFAARAVGIYLDVAPDATVRRNLVVGTANSEFWRGGDTSGAGIVLNNERYHYEGHGGSLAASVQTRGAKVYANLVAFTSSGIAFWGELEESSFDDVIVFNNTLVDNDVQLRLYAKPKPNGKLVNNVLLSLSPGTSDVDRADLAGMTARSNYLSRGDPGGDLSHAGNRYEGIALEKMSGWRDVTAPDGVSWQDFAPTADSTVIGAGDPEPVSMSQGGDTFDLDFMERRFGDPVEIGALKYAPGTELVPKRPTRVRGTP